MSGYPPDVPAPAVCVDDLSKRYGDVVALDGISFETGAGEVFGLLGHNGAGKSTTIRILTGRARPSGGRSRVLGHDVPGDLEAVRGEMNLVAETPTLYERATARENLRLFCKLYGVPASRGDEALERVRLTAAADRKAKTFSTGMRQRLLLARALLNEPRVLFLDEPTRGLDPQSAQELHDLVTELSDNGASVLLTTHDMHEADELCDRVAFLAEGRISALGTPRDLKLEHATSPEVDVLLAGGEELRLQLEDPADVRRLQDELGAGRVRTIHSREPTLGDVFVATAGRALTEDPAP